jgi:hypothetical protein
MATVLGRIRGVAHKRILYLPHAVRQMATLDRLITVSEVRQVVFEGELIEDYPDDVRGHSCLLLGAPRQGAIHVVCSPKTEYLAIITAYIPDPSEWSPDFRRRVD